MRRGDKTFVRRTLKQLSKEQLINIIITSCSDEY